MLNLLVAFSILSAVMVAILAGLIISVVRQGGEYKRVIAIGMTFAVLTIAGYVAFLFAPNELAALILAALYRSSMLCLDMATLFFAVRYTKSNSFMKIPAMVVLGLVIVAVVSEFANIPIGHAYAVELQTYDSVSIWKTTSSIWTGLHSRLVNAIILINVIQLLRATLISPVLYRTSFGVPLVGLLSILGMDAIRAGFNLKLDYSILLLAIFGAMVNYYVNYGVPRRLMSKILRIANYNIDDGYIYYDSQGLRIYANLKARELFADAGKEAKTRMEQYCVLHTGSKIGDEREITWEDTFVNNGEERICEVTYQQVYHANVFLGGYIQMRDKTEEVRQYEKERYQATHDLLTGIYNMERFCDEAEACMARLQKETTGAAPKDDNGWLFLCVNINDFKLINDLFGDKVGDALLIAEADILKERAHKDTIYGRVLDDRFVLLMPKQHFVPETFLAGMSELSKLIKDSSITLHFHIGIYAVTDYTEPIASMYEKATMAAQTLAADDRKYFAYYNPDQMDQLMEEINTVDNFDSALSRGDFPLFIQPQVRTDDKVIGFDVVSYMNTENGPVPIQRKIEQSGNVHRLDRYLWEEAFKALVELTAQGYDKLYFSIKIRAKDLYYIDVSSLLSELAQRYEVDTHRIHVEIAEEVLMLDTKSNMKLIRILREKGFVVVIDDFGSGYSSLNMLKDMSLDAIKMDANIFEGERGKIILAGVMDMAKELDLEIILDWVTEAEQAEVVKRFTDAVYQGSYFSAPFAYKELIDKIRQNRWKVVQ